MLNFVYFVILNSISISYYIDNDIHLFSQMIHTFNIQLFSFKSSIKFHPFIPLCFIFALELIEFILTIFIPISEENVTYYLVISRGSLFSGVRIQVMRFCCSEA
jgi:hypothetical protein